MASLRKSRPKLKDSCDNCATAKVRCGKEKPTCQRCNEKGHACVYSYSCRAGRHLVKGDRSSPALGGVGISSMAASPLFSYPLSADSSTGHMDTHSSFGSHTHSRSDSLTEIYSCPTFYSASSGTPTYQPLSYPISQPESSMGLRDLSTGYNSLPHTRSNSQSFMGGHGSACRHPASTMPCVSDALAVGAVQEPQWGLPDVACLDLEPSGYAGQCMMIGNQTCLARLLSTFGLRPGEFSPVTDFSLSEPTSIIEASSILNHALKGDNDPIAVNKAILDLATSTFACSCSNNDAKLQHLLVAIALNVMARYSTVAFGDDAYLASVVDHGSTPSRSQFVLDELHRVANFLDTLDRRLQNLQQQQQQHHARFRHASTDSQSSIAAGLDHHVYNMGTIPTVNAAAGGGYPCSSASSCSSGIASPDLTTPDPGFAFSAVELRRRLQGLRADIVSSMRSG